MNQRIVLKVSAYYHDSVFALLVGEKLIAAVQEERFMHLKERLNI